MIKRLLILFLITVSLSAPAMASRPQDWEMLETKNFYLYYQAERKTELQEVARMAEGVHDRLTAHFTKMSPYKTHVVITDQLDVSNGFASPAPYPHILLYLSTPTDRTEFGLGQMEWLEYLLTHEYAHILQLGATDGVVESLRSTFGNIFLPAAFVPMWAAEGWAVYAESNFGPAFGGRLQEPVFRKMLSIDYEEGELKSLDKISNLLLEWPGGAVWYNYGALFHKYLGERFGEEKLVAFYHRLAKEPPFLFFERAFRKTFGVSLKKAYQEWQEQLPEQVGPRAPSFGRRLTTTGAYTGAPYYDAKGNLHYIEDNYRGPSRLVKIRDGKPVPLANWDAEGEYLILPDGDLIFTQYRWEEDRFFSDLYRADGRKEKVKRLTVGKRASQPTVSPDGKWVAFTVNDPPVRHISLLNLENGEIKPLLVADEEYSYSSPAWSPEGTILAVVVERKRYGRRIELVDPESGLRSPLTGWWWEEGEPSWNPSGRYLVFTAQVDGEVNLYAFDLLEQEVRLLAPGVGGGVVSPDGKELAFIGLSAQGQDIYLADFTPLAGKVVALPTPAAPRPVKELPAVEAKASSYRPWPSLRPYYWLPMLQSDANGTTFGFYTSGNDALDFFGYEVSLGVGWGWKTSYDIKLTTSLLGPDLELHVDSLDEYGAELSKTWRSVLAPSDVFRLGAGWGKSDGWQSNLYYSDARRYGLNPEPSNGIALAVNLFQLGENGVFEGRINHYSPLGRGVLITNLQGAGALREKVSFGLPGYGQDLVGSWRAGTGVEVKGPLIEFQRGLITPPVYFLDTWGGLGVDLYKVDGNEQFWPTLITELQLRMGLGFSTVPYSFKVRLCKGLIDGEVEASISAGFSW